MQKYVTHTWESSHTVMAVTSAVLIGSVVFLGQMIQSYEAEQRMQVLAVQKEALVPKRHSLVIPTSYQTRVLMGEEIQKLKQNVNGHMKTVQQQQAVIKINAEILKKQIGGEGMDKSAGRQLLLKAGLRPPITPKNSSSSGEKDAQALTLHVIREVVRDEVDSFARRIQIADEVSRAILE